MSEIRLAQLLSNVKEEYIEDAAPEQPRSIRSRLIKWGALAACLILAVGAVRFAQEENFLAADNAAEAPQNAAPEYGGTGFEGYLLEDPAQFLSANPWDPEAGLTALPVFQNLWPLTQAGAPAQLPQDTESAIVDDLTRRLGNLAGQADISVEGGHFVRIEFSPTLSLPDTYHFQYGATEEELRDCATYLLSEYGHILPMDNPILAIEGGDMDIHGTQLYSISFYEDAEGSLEQLLNYHFRTARFHCDDNGRLLFIDITMSDLSEEVGTYPIITIEEARSMLLEGSYATSVPYPISQDAAIVKTELVYRTNRSETHFLPYYKFLVELPEETSVRSIQNYGAYYVPALPEPYLSDFPIWNGSFNH